MEFTRNDIISEMRKCSKYENILEIASDLQKVGSIRSNILLEHLDRDELITTIVQCERFFISTFSDFHLAISSWIDWNKYKNVDYHNTVFSILLFGSPSDCILNIDGSQFLTVTSQSLKKAAELTELIKSDILEYGSRGYEFLCHYPNNLSGGGIRIIMLPYEVHDFASIEIYYGDLNFDDFYRIEKINVPKKGDIAIEYMRIVPKYFPINEDFVTIDPMDDDKIFFYHCGSIMIELDQEYQEFVKNREIETEMQSPKNLIIEI